MTWLHVVGVGERNSCCYLALAVLEGGGLCWIGLIRHRMEILEKRSGETMEVEVVVGQSPVEAGGEEGTARD